MNTGGYPYTVPRVDLDRSPDRQGFISSDSFHAEDRSQASSYLSQPNYQVASHQWRSSETSYTQPIAQAHHLPRRHSNDRHAHTQALQESYIAPQRSLPPFEQGGASINGIGSGSSQETYNRSPPHSTRRDTALSLPYEADYVATQNAAVYPNGNANQDFFSVPPSVPSNYTTSSTRPISSRRYSTSGQQHQQHQHQSQHHTSFAPFNQTQQQQQHQHQGSYDNYPASTLTSQSQFESSQAQSTPPNYTIARPEEWQTSLHHPSPQVPANTILHSSSASRTGMHSHSHPQRSYPGLNYEESTTTPMMPLHTASMPPTPSQHDFSIRSPVEEVRYSSQSLSGSDEFHNYMDDRDDMRTLDDGASIGEGSMPPSSTSSQPKPKRRRADPSQLRVLNEVYARTAFPSTEERADLGRQLNMTPRQVQIWFQNRRQNAKAGRPPPGSPPSDPRQQSLSSTPPMTPVAHFPGYPALQAKTEGHDPDYTYYQGPMRR
ncbi:hypothetical protein FRB96_001553 [Tulasnella sp. 330]|nr:hypothetical protein FRB96_001553 [Tulasnella sp. 330]